MVYHTSTLLAAVGALDNEGLFRYSRPPAGGFREERDGSLS